MKNNQYYLCLPIEVSKRELLAKLHLGMHAAMRGYPVVIGDHDSEVFKRVYKGFFLYKDHAPWSERRFKQVKDNGLEFGCLDEEGLIYKSPEIYKATRCSEKILSEADAVFYWGDTQKSVINAPHKHNQHLTGNPRIDLLNTSGSNRKASRIKKILINTRFTSCNAFRGHQEIKNLRKLNIIKNKGDLEDYQHFITNDQIIYQEFLELIEKLSTRKNIQITIRPHPAENLAPYLTAAKGKRNVLVDQKSELVEQILSHDMVIHDGCTTAIEAQAANRLVIGLRPQGVNMKYGHFANKFSMNFHNAESICQFIDRSSPEDYTLNMDNDWARCSIWNWRGGHCESINSILSVIDGFRERKGNSPDQCCPSPLKLGDSIIYNINKILKKKAIRSAFSTALRSPFKDYMQRVDMRDHKFPKLNEDTIRKLILQITEIDTTLAPPSNYNLQLLGEKSFKLTYTK